MTEVQQTDETTPQQQQQSLQLSPERVLDVADELSSFCDERGLTSNIKGNRYAQVEAWQFVGSQLGVTEKIKEIRDLSDGNETKYSARVDLINMDTGEVIGSGFAICSDNEPNKRSFEEYAIASMAQTRAIGKAYRNKFGFLMKAAGFNPTPAEEMDEVHDDREQTDSHSDQTGDSGRKGYPNQDKSERGSDEDQDWSRYENEEGLICKTKENGDPALWRKFNATLSDWREEVDEQKGFRDRFKKWLWEWRDMEMEQGWSNLTPKGIDWILQNMERLVEEYEDSTYSVKQ